MMSAGRDRALTNALLGRAELWQAALARVRRLAFGRAASVRDALAAVDDYRLLARDLAAARRLIPDGRTREYLEAAYAQAHAVVHRGASHPGYALLRLLRDEIPRVVRELRLYIAGVAALMAIAMASGFWMVHTYPDLIGLFASPELIATVERGELWTEGLLNVVPSSVLSAQILTNNIVVSLFAFCAGLLFGLGTFYIVALNGLMLGAVLAFTSQHTLAGRLLAFMLPHGCVELSVMCLSGAAGAAVGEALIRPGEATRAESFRLAAARGGKLLFACVLLLVGCGLIEGYVSPDPEFPLWSRVVIGGGYWLFMVALLSGWLFGRKLSRRDEPI